jgi:hypothetical protein
LRKLHGDLTGDYERNCTRRAGLPDARTGQPMHAEFAPPFVVEA